MSKARFGALVLSAAFTLLCGCQSLQQLVQAPSVNVAGVKLQDISFQAVTLDFDLKVHNPNGFGASLNGFDYKFALEEKELFSGNNNNPLTIPAMGESHVHIPLTLNFKEIYGLIQNTKSLDSLKYQISGNLAPGGLLSGFPIPFSKSGSLPNIRLPEVALQGLKVNKINLTGIDLDLAIKMKNPNSFGFDIGKLDYSIQLAGQPVASGMAEKLVSVAKKGTGEIHLPIKLDFLGAASSLKTALAGGSIDCAVSGGADLATPFGLLNLPLETKQKIAIVK